METERELTGGVHVKTHHDSLGRETYKSVGARNVEQFRRSYTWGIGNRLHATEDGLTGRRVRYDYDEFDNLLSAEYKQGNDVELIHPIAVEQGTTISVPAGSSIDPVTSVVRK